MKISTIVLSAAIVATSALTATVASAQSATNYGQWENYKGTRDLTVNSYGKSSNVTVTDFQTLKLDGTGSQNRGDIYFRNGQLSGGYWSKGAQDDKAPGFVAGYAENGVSVDRSSGGFNSRLTEWGTFNGSSDTLRIGQ